MTTTLARRLDRLEASSRAASADDLVEYRSPPEAIEITAKILHGLHGGSREEIVAELSKPELMPRWMAERKLSAAAVAQLDKTMAVLRETPA